MRFIGSVRGGLPTNFVANQTRFENDVSCSHCGHYSPGWWRGILLLFDTALDIIHDFYGDNGVYDIDIYGSAYPVRIHNRGRRGRLQ